MKQIWVNGYVWDPVFQGVCNQWGHNAEPPVWYLCYQTGSS